MSDFILVKMTVADDYISKFEEIPVVIENKYIGMRKNSRKKFLAFLKSSFNQIYAGQADSRSIFGNTFADVRRDCNTNLNGRDDR